MGTYRLHTLVSGRSVQKSRKISRKKSIWTGAAVEEHYWALCALLDILSYFHLECPLCDHHPVPAQGWWGTDPAGGEFPGSSGTGGVGCPEVPHFKTSQPLLCSWSVLHICVVWRRLSTFRNQLHSDNNISQGSPVLLCQKEKRKLK